MPVPLRVAWREHAEAEGGVLRCVERIGERSGVARLVAEADRQQQHDPAYLSALMDQLATAEGGGADLVIGARFAGEGDPYKVSLLRVSQTGSTLALSVIL